MLVEQNMLLYCTSLDSRCPSWRTRPLLNSGVRMGKRLLHLHNGYTIANLAEVFQYFVRYFATVICVSRTYFGR